MDQKNANFWSMLEKQEMDHADNIAKMIGVVSRKPEHFQRGRSFSPIAVEMFKKGIDGNREKIQSGAVPRDKFLFLARDNEQSLLEQRYQEVLRTNDIEYMTLVQHVLSETMEHKKHIEAKIAETRKG